MYMDMKLTLMLFVCARAAKLEIDGEVSFSLKIPEVLNRAGGSQVTAGSVVECIYQYPEQKQIDAILSNMMNVLTKVFVRTRELFTRESARRAEQHQHRHQRPVTRFRVVNKKKTLYFEDIYHNMTDEYNKFYNSTAQRVDRAHLDPCEHQPEMKEIWRELLERAEVACARAAKHCLEEQLADPSPRPRAVPPDPRLRARLHALLASELGKLRAKQLHILCDHFQLCFNDLL